MSRHFSILGLFGLAALVAAVAGCRPQQPFYFHDDGDLSHYIGQATEIEYPDVESCTLDEVSGAIRPLTLDNPDPTQTWELPLEEAVRIALENSKVLRNLGGIAFGPGGAQGEPTVVTQQPELVPTIYDPARFETDPRFGVEAALSAFDTQFATSVFWEKVDQPQNIAAGSPFEPFRPDILEQDLGTFQTQLSKVAATGSVFSLTHNVQYEWSNVEIRAFPSDWRTNVEAQFRQPLLRGAGVQFNRIAGPGSIPGFYNGVMIARIRTDIALHDFEAGVRNLVRDVERAYWELYYAYRRLDAVIAGRDSALQTWRQAKAAFDVGGVRPGEQGTAARGSAQDEAQARQQYFLFRSAAEQALDNLYRTENNLRYMLGLGPTDGRLIRPGDEPTTALVQFDWYQSHLEAITRSVELRQQKFRVKQRELEVIASKNFLLPRLDATGRYRWLGLGDELIDPDNSDINAYGNMTGGDFQEWQVGLEAEFTIGFRREMAGVRQAQLNLARERAVLQEAELEVSHQLANAIRELEDNYKITQTNFNRYIAGKDEYEAVLARYELGETTLDLLLDAQRRLAEAVNDYYRSLINYNEAIISVHFRKGSLLEYNGVYLAEGPWPAKAYFDALRRARARDAGHYIDYGFTRPKVMSRGPVNQCPGGLGVAGAPTMAPTPAPAATGPEEIPTPAPLKLEDGGQTPTEAPPRPISGDSAAVGGNGNQVSQPLHLNPPANSVQQASFQQSASSARPAAAASSGWKGNGQPSLPHANSTRATSSTASGWKGSSR
jgi:outer membrane protein TolC